MPAAPATVLLHGHGITVYPAGTSCGPRTLGDWEFVWIVAGSCIYQHEGADQAFLPGDIALVRPGQRHAFVWDKAGYTRHGYIHFSMSDLDQDLPAPHTWPCLRRMPADDLLRPLLNHALAALSAGDTAFAARCLQLALAAFVSGAGGAPRAESAAPPLIQSAFAWIADRWVEDGMRQLPLTDLARAVGVSPGHLDRAFRKHLGLSPMEAQRRLRLDRAARMLRDGGQSVQTAAAATGFASPFHCSRRFRACFGISPSALRGGASAGLPLPELRPPELARLAERVWLRVGR